MAWLGLHNKDLPASCPAEEFTPRDRALVLETLSRQLRGWVAAGFSSPSDTSKRGV